MSMIATDIKGLLSIKIKSRVDGYSDQYNRIFMVKMLLAISFIMGISWYKDSINCIVPESHGIDPGFVSAACWIQGAYIYKALQDRVDDTAFFGIPKVIDHNGMTSDGQLCTTSVSANPNKPEVKHCVEMEKTYYLQYQWMPFLIAAFGLLYYLPYMFGRAVNNDVITLKYAIKKNNDAKDIVKHYFSRKRRFGANCFRILSLLLIKILYIGSNLTVFISLHILLNGRYFFYGVNWIEWSQLNNTMAYDYMGLRGFAKPGNELLPPFGYCELYEGAEDVKLALQNKHKFVCELSQNVLYQYCLLVLWFMVLIGIIVSVFGLLCLLGYYLFAVCIKARVQARKRLYGVNLSFRELEYLDFIRSKNKILYGDVLERLREDKE